MSETEQLETAQADGGRPTRHAPGGDQTLAFVTRCALALTTVGVVACWVVRPGEVQAPLGLGLGAALALGNFWLSRRIVARMLSEGGGVSAGGLLIAKMLGFFGLVYLAFQVLPVDEVGFAGGLFVVVLSIVIGNAFGPKASVESGHNG